MAYTTKENVVNRMGIQNPSGSIDSVITSALAQVDSFIDEYTSTTFSDEVTQKAYYFTGTNLLHIPFTKQVISVSWIAGMTIQTLVSDDGDFYWSNRVIIFNKTAPPTNTIINVNGIHGYGVKAEIEDVATMLVAEKVRERARSTGEAYEYSMDGVTFKYQPLQNAMEFAMMVLDKYRTFVV